MRRDDALKTNIAKTIIECLKYSTTGDLPPNSKGGAFLHDPKMTGDKEVRAQVKLAFTNASGVSMICTRAMLLTLKKTTSTFKTLEGQLLALHRGERTTISTKCAELDVQVPNYLGVSKSILDYVIFCHQDESLWPLAEPSVLKKRFDEIFEALKFTKALDNIKVIRKDMTVEIKLLDQSVKHLKQDKERADRVREKMDASYKTVDTYKQETVLLEEELRRITKQSDDLFKSNQAFQKVLSKLESYRHSQRSLNEQIDRLEDSTTLLPDTDEDLQYKIANFQTVVRDAEKKVEELKNEVGDKQANLRTLREDYSNMISEEGQLKGKEADYKLNLQKRSDLVKSSITELDMDVSPDDFIEFENTLNTQTHRSQRLLQSMTSDSKKEEAVVEQKLKLVSDSKLKETQHREYANNDIKSIENENKSLATKINNLDVNEGGLEYEKLKLEDLESKLDEFRNQKIVEKLVKEIRGKNTEISSLETEIETMNHEISQSHKQSDTYAKISLLNDEKNYREKALAKLITTNENIFNSEALDLEDLEKSFKEKVSKLQNEVKEGEKELKRLNDRSYKLESEFQFKKLSITNLTKELETSEKKFKDELEDEDVEDYDEVLGSAEDDYKIALENLKMSSTTLQFNKKALEIAEKDQCCYLCSRKFDETSVLSTFIKELKSKTESGFEKQLEEQLQSQKEYLNTVRSLASVVDRIVTTKRKVAELDSEIKSITPSLEESKNKLDEQTKKVDEIRNKLTSLEDIKGSVNEISRMRQDLKNIEAQIAAKERELNDYGFSPRSLDELQKEQNSKSSELKNLRKEVANLLEDKDSKQRELSVLEGNVKDMRLKISNIERSLIEKENITKTIEENKNRIVKLHEMVEKSDGIIKELTMEIDSVTKELDTLRKENGEKITKQQKELEALTSHKNLFTSLNDAIKVYIERDIKLLEKCQEEVSLIGTLITEHEEAIEAASIRVSEEEKKLADTNNEERNLKNNLDIRHMQNKLREIEIEISEMNVQNAESERDRYQEESSRLREEYSSMNAELAGKMGEIKQIEDQAKQYQKELNSEFKDIEKSYQEEWVKLQTKTLVLNDLGTYSKALDSAIMQYHSIKMKEINRIIDELWKGTYSGTDVDTIMIKSDQNTASKGNRSYNYRVVMVKQDAELDMRGRCSAGQKVLASIIIRLALAECFGTNCGVIALDEPTTNLDAENIESLARSLGNIIELRQAQKNFQLIVITHDEKFLTYMNAAKYTDHFYRVRRNDAQKSQIDWVNITRVSE